MTTPPASPEPPFTPEHSTAMAAGGDEPPTHGRGRKILKWTAISMASVLVLGAGFVAADAWYLNHRIKHTCFTSCLPVGTVEPTKQPDAAKAQNFVLIGSDSRAGKSGKGTGGSKIQGARSDTTIIMHISAGNSGATLVSIPRDSYVQIPSCVVGPNNQTSAPQQTKFNAAFSIGSEYDNKYGPACTVHTIETLTGIHIDHFAVIDFAGFQSMVKALGGVKMCVAHDLIDPVVQESDGAYHGSGLDLHAGPSVEIDGDQALALMRARYALDGGGDLPRIKRQQQFIGAMIRKATSTGLLVDLPKLQSFLKAATGALTTDGFGLGTMKTLASALHRVGAGGVRILTVPNLTSYPGMPYGDVEWDPTKAPALWNSIKHDQPIPGTKAKPTPGTSTSPSASPSPKPTQSGPPLSIPPSSITVNVLNGTTQPGVAHSVARKLQKRGFTIGTVGNAPTTDYTKTTVTYGSEKVQSSQTVQESIPGAVRKKDLTSTTSVTVIVGTNFSRVIKVVLGTPTTPSATPTPKISSISAAKPSCLS